MKTVFTTILLLMATINVFGATKIDSNDPQPISIDIYKKMTQTTSELRERSLAYYELAAYVFPTSNEVEVTIFNVGDATISIFDNYGRVIDSINVNSDIPSTIHLNITSGKGDYYIVVSSPIIYAEGLFTI